MLKHEELKSILSYDLQTGEFVWAEDVNPRAMKGYRAGTLRPDGYVQIRINGKLYLAHRLAWFYVYGEWPSCEIDHISRNRSDNRITNLRVGILVNRQNTPVRKDNKTGVKGVHWYQNRYVVTLPTVKTDKTITLDASKR